MDYNDNGDTTDYQIYNNGEVVKERSSESQSSAPTFFMNEEPAEFPGGESAWQKYIGNNLKYPDSLQSIKGQVILKFVINQKGIIESIEILKSLQPLLDKEAIRVIMNSPKWKPAKQNGKNVQSIKTQPINFG